MLINQYGRLCHLHRVWFEKQTRQTAWQERLGDFDPTLDRFLRSWLCEALLRRDVTYVMGKDPGVAVRSLGVTLLVLCFCCPLLLLAMPRCK